VPYRRVLRSESATWGSALIAGAACGAIPELTQGALETAPLSEEIIQPDPKLCDTYKAALGRYLSWQQSLQAGFASCQEKAPEIAVGEGFACPQPTDST